MTNSTHISACSQSRFTRMLTYVALTWGVWSCGPSTPSSPGTLPPTITSSRSVTSEDTYAERGLVRQDSVIAVEARGQPIPCPASSKSWEGQSGAFVAFGMCVVGHDGTSFRVRDGGSLVAGEIVHMSVSVAEPAHVSIVQFQNGVLTRLWPSEAGGAGVGLAAGERLAIPEPGAGYRFVVDEDAGPFSVFIIASIRALEISDPALSALVEEAGSASGRFIDPATIGSRKRRSAFELRQGVVVDRPEAVPQPDDVGPMLDERGLVRENSEATGIGILGQPDSDGVAVLEFRVTQQRRNP